jgi:hypothetical protein
VLHPRRGRLVDHEVDVRVHLQHRGRHRRLGDYSAGFWNFNTKRWMK